MSVNAVPAAGVNVVSPPITFGTKVVNSPILMDGTGAGTPGIKFTANATSLPKQGQYQWVQLVNYDNISFLSSGGRFANEPTITGDPELDGSFPYLVTKTVTAPNDTATDSPYLLLTSDNGEQARSFQATMTLMWDPVLPAGCSPAIAPSTPSTCTSLPVPLASVTWGHDGDAIDTQIPQNGTVPYVLWLKQCGAPNQGPSTSPTPYPIWTTTINPQ